MWMRILAAVVLLPLLVVMLFWLPTLVTTLVCSLALAIAAYELLWGTGLVKHVRLTVYTALMAALMPLWCHFGMGYLPALIVVFLFTAVLFAEVLISKLAIRFDQITVCLAGGLLIPFLLSALIRIHGAEQGRAFVAIPFVLAFMSDSGAYFVGCAIGKHKLAPVISPKKSVEGLFGGIVGSVLGMVIYCLVLQNFFGFRVSYVWAAVYGVLGSLLSTFGDLCFSAIKRQVGIKDYGNLIPGHGGVLDRFDSMTVVAPLAEILLMLLPVAVK